MPKTPPNKQIEIHVSTTLLDIVKGVTFIIVAAMACSAFPRLPLQVPSGDGSCSTWQVNCCHLVDESKTATKAWTRNKKKKCPQTHKDQESLGSKSGRISFLKFLFECNFWYAYVLISYMNLTGLKAIEASDPAMITQLKAVFKKKKKKRKEKKGTKLHYENWYAANILSNSTAFNETNHKKYASVFVLCNMCEKEY